MVRLHFTMVKVALLKTKTPFFRKKFAFYLVNPKKCITFASSKTKYRMAVDDLLPKSAAFLLAGE